MKPVDAYRSLVCAGARRDVRKHGRLSITMTFNQRITVARGGQIVLLGSGLQYELWRRDDGLARP
jgi:DNA-binding transcriptional regulator/RsmH inhibitor MraZ